MSVRNMLSMTNSPARPEEEISPPDEDQVLKEGWLYVSVSKKKSRFERRYFLLKKGAESLYHMKSPKEFNRARPVPLVLAQVSPVSVKGQRNAFQIVSREGSTLCRAETLEEMKEWVQVLQTTCSELFTVAVEDEEVKPHNQQLSNVSELSTESATPSPQMSARSRSGSDFGSQRGRAGFRSTAVKSTLDEFLLRNDFCADCNMLVSEGSAFVSLKIGCVLCEECCLCHRQLLGAECSDAHALQENSKNIPFFDPKQHPMSVTFLNHIGNKKANDYWEANLSGYNKPTPNSTKKERMMWVMEKYLRKTFRGQKCGYLSVRNKKKAKRYWVVLEVSTVNLYSSKDDMKAHDIIVLQSCGVKVGDDPASPETFTIITPQKTFRLEAMNFPEAMEWANAISVASASLMKQLTNASASIETGPKRATLPTECLPNFEEKKKTLQPIHRFNIDTDNTEWGRTLTSVLQLEEKIENFRNTYRESQISVAQRKIQGLQDQQFEVSNLLLSLPPREFRSALEGLVKDPETDLIKGGPVDALIEYVITDEARSKYLYPHAFFHLLMKFATENETYLNTFLLTYRVFTTPTLFLCELSKHFNRNNPALQTNIIKYLDNWVTHHFYDLAGDGNAMRILLAFLEKPVAKCGFTNEADTLRSTVRNQLTARLFPTRVLYDTAPEPILPTEQQLEFLTLNDLDDKEVARQLTLIDQKLFQAIRPQELLTLSWMDNDKAITAPNVTRFLDRFTAMTNWILTTINKLDKPKRPIMLSKFIQIAKHCKDLRNYNAVMQIVAALEDTVMHRFDGTLEGINQKYVPILLDLRKLTKSDNFTNLKQELSKRSAPTVPYLQAYLLEIQNIEMEEQNFLDTLVTSGAPRQINFAKFQKIASVIAELQRYQKDNYILRPQPAIQNYLNSVSYLSRAELSVLATLTHHREEVLGLNSLEKMPDFGPPPDEAPTSPPEEATPVKI